MSGDANELTATRPQKSGKNTGNFLDKILDNCKTQETLEFYEFGSFRLDAEERGLWRGDELVPLTPKEFEVLFYLVARAGRVAEKGEPLDAIRADTFVEETMLARNIS